MHTRGFIITVLACASQFGLLAHALPTPQNPQQPHNPQWQQPQNPQWQQHRQPNMQQPHNPNMQHPNNPNMQNPKSPRVQHGHGLDIKIKLKAIDGFELEHRTHPLYVTIPPVQRLLKLPHHCKKDEGVTVPPVNPVDQFCYNLRNKLCEQEPSMHHDAKTKKLNFEICDEHLHIAHLANQNGMPQVHNNGMHPKQNTMPQQPMRNQNAPQPFNPNTPPVFTPQPHAVVHKHNAGFSLYPAITMIVQAAALFAISLAML